VLPASASTSRALDVKAPYLARPQVSYGSILTPLGVFLLAYGFGAFFQVGEGLGIRMQGTRTQSHRCYCATPARTTHHTQMSA